MGRKSHADLIIEKFKDLPENGDQFLTVYDFHGGNPTRFYRNLKKVLDYFGGHQLQLSVIKSDSRRCALAVRELAKSTARKGSQPSK